MPVIIPEQQPALRYWVDTHNCNQENLLRKLRSGFWQPLSGRFYLQYKEFLMVVIFHLAWEWIYDGPVLLGSILLFNNRLRLQGFPQDFPDIRNSLLDLLQERHSSLAQGSTPEGNLDRENGTDLGTCVSWTALLCLLFPAMWLAR